MRYTTTRPMKRLSTKSKNELKVMIKGSREVKIQNHLDLLEISTEGCFIKYIETGELFYSSGWKKRLGIENLTPKEAGNAYTKLVHPEDIPVINKVYSDAFERKLSKIKMEFRIKTLDKGYIWALEQVGIVYNREGKPIKPYGSNIVDFVNVNVKKREDKKNPRLLYLIYRAD